MLSTIVYLIVLACGIAWCYRQDVPRWRLCTSLCCISVTWFYIIRFMVNYVGPNAFDGAYADVIWGGREGNWAFTQALLTWALLAMVWSHEACVAYQIFGVFGAMSASFLVYCPAPHRSPEPVARRVPVSYALCAFGGFVCTWMLPRSGELEDLGWWLYGLHAALLVPKFVPSSLAPSVDACLLYCALAVLSLFTHLLAGSSPWPVSDCQISITVDLFVCSFITVLHVWNFARACGLGLQGVCAVVLAAITLSPLCSPGFVLGMLGASQQGLHRRAVTWLQHAAASRYGAGEWQNLGLWKDVNGGGFNAAGAALAQAVGQAVLHAGDRALCVGCGRGSELLLLRKAFGLTSVTGLDADEEAARAFQDDGEVRLVCALVEDMGSLRQTGFRHGDFNKILAVDSIYHCDRSRFLRDCAKLLPEGGAVAVSDVIVSPSAPLWVRGALQAMNIPWTNHWTEKEYRQRLSSEGFEVEAWTSLEPHVLAHWLPDGLRRHLDYVLISATLRRHPRRPKVAVIGSGMSGCLTARLLSETHEVTVFEAGPAINFAGHSLQVEGVTVDVPLRMIGPIYYREMARTIEELHVPTTPSRFDSVFYSKSRLLFISNVGVLQSFIERLGHLTVLARMTAALFFMPPGERTTFGEYAKEHGFRDSEPYRVFILPQLSWMLSCDMSMVEGYPATAVNGFLKAINPLASFSRGILRINPCNKVMQDAMMEGIDVRLNQAVSDVSEDRTICGESFDAVVVATEAKAVPKILKSRPWASAFNQFKYHPSSVVLHRDASLLPQSQEDWRVLNVGINAGEGGSMLTVWMNAYYGSVGSGPLGPFSGNVFQTWNPHLRPAEDTIIQESSFTRVVHDAETPRLLREICDLQGRDGIYFAGAYAVHGMGLLEQAVCSAQVVVAAIHADARRRSEGQDCQ